MVEDKIVIEESKFKELAGKIHIEAYANTLGKKLNKNQKEVADYFYGEKRKTWDYMTLLASRQWGKSFFLKLLAQAEAILPYANVAIITPGSVKLALEHYEEISREFDQIPQLKELGMKFDKQNRKITFEKTKSSVKFSSEDSWENDIIGRGFSLIICDEGFKFDSGKYKEMYGKCRPTGLRYDVYSDTKLRVAKWVVVSTPRKAKMATEMGVNYFRGEIGDRGFVSIKHTIYDCAHVSAEYIENEKESVYPSEWNTEYMCEFEPDEGTVFNKFDVKRHVKKTDHNKLKRIGSELLLIVASDFAFTDGNGSLFILYSPVIEKYYIVDYHYKKGELLRDFIDIIVTTEKKIKKKYGISDKNVISLADPSKTKEASAEAWRDHKYKFAKAKNDRTQGFDHVNDLFDGDQIEIDEDLKEVIRQFQFAEFKAVAGAKTNLYAKDRTHGTHYELCDCIRYGGYTNKFYSKKSGVILG